MRRLLILIGVATLALSVTACGTTADPNAAVVNGQPITIESANSLARDAVFVRTVVNAEVPPNESILPGDVARATLMFQVQRAALVTELKRWGLQVSSKDLAAADAQLDQILAGSGAPVQQKPSVATRKALAEFLAAGSVLDRRLASISPTNQQDLTRIYEGTSAFWKRVCIAVVQVDPSALKSAERLADKNVPLEKWSKKEKRAALVADPKKACISSARLPVEFVQPVRTTPVGKVVGPITVSSQQGQAAFWFRIDSRIVLSQKEAGAELAELAGSVAQQGSAALIGLTLLSDVTVNPQYGTGVELGTQGGVVIGRPEGAPQQTALLDQSGPTDQAPPGQAPTDQAPRAAANSAG